MKKNEDIRYAGYAAENSKKEAENRLRSIPATGFAANSTDMVSNDYMGLAVDSHKMPLYWEGIPALIKEEYEKLSGPNGLWRTQLLNTPGMWSSSASRLLSTRQRIPHLLESILESDYGKPVLIFNSGYHANTGTIGALNLPGTIYLVDKLMHASVWDGLLAGRCNFERFGHNNMKELRKLVEKHAKEAARIVIVAESIYSMDGDRAPMKELIEIRREYKNVLLYIDEAHAYGCYGERGLGVCEEEGIIEETDIIVGTFGKAGGSAGAFVVATEPLHTHLINSARSFIFSTALPPAIYFHSTDNHLRLRGAKKRREELARKSAALREVITEKWGKTSSESQIVPIIAGSAEKALQIADTLRANGISALAIRRPTVPAGTERVRVSASALTPDNVIEKIGEILSKIR